MKLVEATNYVTRDEQAVRAYRALFPYETTCTECKSKIVAEGPHDVQLSKYCVGYDYKEYRLVGTCPICGYPTVVTEDSQILWGYFLMERPLRVWFATHVKIWLPLLVIAVVSFLVSVGFWA